MFFKSYILKQFIFLINFLLIIPIVNAQESQNDLELELNLLETNQNSCNMIFVVNNKVSFSLESLVLETVFFDDEGNVTLLTLFDYGEIPKLSMRVSQFEIPDKKCENIGKILINGIESCEFEKNNIDCKNIIAFKNKTQIELID